MGQLFFFYAKSHVPIRVGRPAVDHVDRYPSGNNESWVNFFSMQNPTCICRVKMKPMTQRNLPRSFKAIQLEHGQIFDVRRRGLPSFGDAQKSITHGSTFFYAKSQVHMRGQNEAVDTKKPPKIFQGNPTCARLNLRPRGSPSIKYH
ncbi:uncharacterized protein G2W53_026927 [Senna tora]|uniref:Uncharacterized protein n=1 Tax=Senna tora TaxID=362788 RepID=A0A834TFY1_9FABA|nr:uncharacterized protein G2W53_026927 [Senna tora]